MLSSRRPGKRWRTSGLACPDEVRVVIVCGEGASFSAGLDRSAPLDGRRPRCWAGWRSRRPRRRTRPSPASSAAFSWLADPRFVSIAAVSGHAIGAGFQLALACDLIVVADDAQFRMAEVSLGPGPRPRWHRPGWSGPSGISGPWKSARPGRHVRADEAVRIGLALACVPVDELDAAVADLAAALVESPAGRGAGDHRADEPGSDQLTGGATRGRATPRRSA